MGDKGKLLGVGILFISALYLFVAPTNILIPSQQTNVVEQYPFQDNWTENGTLSGNAVDNSGTLTLSASGEGTFTSDEKYVPTNNSLSFDNLVVNTKLKDSNDNGEIRVYGLNSNGVIQESTFKSLDDGTKEYSIEEGEYDGYKYQIVLESSDNKYPEIDAVKVEYDESKPLTDNNLAKDILAWLMVLAGIGLIFL